MHCSGAARAPSYSDGAPVPSVSWVRQFGGTGSDRALTVAVDAENNAYVVGFTETTTETQAFVRKYDQTGQELWNHQFGAGVAGSETIATSAATGGTDLLVAIIHYPSLAGTTGLQGPSD